MNGYLLDTHALLWAVQEDWKLSPAARAVIERMDSKLFVSAISAFEIGNKYRLGKLPEYSLVVENYHEIVQKLGAVELPVRSSHAYYAAKTEWPHRDPFDRILAAQAALENLTLISGDAAFSGLSWVSVLW
ncbi:MAG: type II toxin-antitoxin system VapC family toxin [Candidatus Accumulibacter sp.]|jgi:PIN domain nuclease of toxin-antitoxin system|nr:type II toxin-antitoxin system VapC family toxin [Accumulibacter sp.]